MLPMHDNTDKPEQDAACLVVLGTGGTIAGRAASTTEHLRYDSAQLPVQALLAALPCPAGTSIECEQVAQCDSKDMGPAIWRRLLVRVQHHLGRREVRGVVITHGTDTLEETAFLLQAVLNPSKPVVLASAMRPSTALVPDGPQNLADALVVAAEPGARGVMVVCSGQVLGAWDVQKVHPYRVAAFEAGEAGPLGGVEQGRCVWWRAWPEAVARGRRDALPALLARTDWPRVEWISSYAGATGALVDALLAQRVQAMGQGAYPLLQGLVVAGTGNGTLHADLLPALQRAQQAGVAVRLTTRCAAGRVVIGGNEPFEVLPWPPAKARLALMLELL